MRGLRLMAAGVLLAGCAAPARFQAVAAEARAAEAESVLRQAFVMQEAHRADHARYATTFAQLAAVGWEDPAGLRQYHSPRIVRAQADALCMEMLPLRDDLWAQHVDQSGEVKRGPCP